DDGGNAVAVHVEAGDGGVGLRNLPLLFDLHDLIACNDRHTEALRVFDSFQVNLRAVAALDEVGGGLAHALFVNVIPEDHAHQIVIHEVLGQRKRGSDAAFAFLVRVVEVLQT